MVCGTIRKEKKMATISNNSPAFMLWCVDGDGKEARWTRIGAAWLHQDGKGFNLRCAAIPLQGRLVARAYTPKEARDDRQGGLV